MNNFLAVFFLFVYNEQVFAQNQQTTLEKLACQQCKQRCELDGEEVSFRRPKLERSSGPPGAPRGPAAGMDITAIEEIVDRRIKLGESWT